MVCKNFDQIIERVKGFPSAKRMAVAAAGDEHTLEAVMHARKEGIVDPILVGDKAVIDEILSKMGETVAEENIYDYDNNEEEVEDKKIFGRKNNNKVVNMPQAQSQAIKMVISQPTTFEQSDEICSFLKEKKSVIVNLEYVNKDVARRIVDFISGGVYALDGYIQKVSNSIFLVAPSNYEITNEMAREEIKNKLSVSWLKNNNVNN